jgi:hypothetical protein
MPSSLPVIIVNGVNVCAQFEPKVASLVPVEKKEIKLVGIGPLEELDIYKLATISLLILYSL